MIKIERLANCKGSDKFGSCSSCGSYEDKNKLLRIKCIDEGQGVSVVLCNECIKQLKRLLSGVWVDG